MAQKSKSLRERAYNYLIKAFQDQKLTPGDILNRRVIAAKLRMSVAPVLEAMVQLEAEGMLERVPRKGILVRALTQEEVWGNMMLREAIECQAARLYCGEAIRENEKRLLQSAAELDALPQSAKAWMQEVSFHRALVELARCRSILAAYDQMMRTSLFLQVDFFSHPDSTAKSSRHTTLVRKLRTDDPDVAEHCVRSHLNTPSAHPFTSFTRKTTYF